MASYKIILLDSDVISHFLVAGQLGRLEEVLSPNKLFVVENVYKEAIKHPTDEKRKEKIDAWLRSGKVIKIPFHFNNEKVKLEFFRLKKERPLLGEGERACLSMARYGKEIVASSNFRDVKEYAEANDIEYLGCLDILYIAWKRGRFSLLDCNIFITDTIRENRARFPVSRMEEYIPDRDLSSYIITSEQIGG